MEVKKVGLETWGCGLLAWAFKYNIFFTIASLVNMSLVYGKDVKDVL